MKLLKLELKYKLNSFKIDLFVGQEFFAEAKVG